MIHRLYTVYDSKAEFYSKPFYARSTGEALRQFQAAANDNQNSIGLYPEDYALFEMGEFDELSGEINLLEAYKSLGRAIDYVQIEGAEQFKPAEKADGKPQ